MTGLLLSRFCVAWPGPGARTGPGAQVTWISPPRWYAPAAGMGDYSPVVSGYRLRGSVEVRAGAGYFLHPAGASQRRYEALRAYFTEDMPASEVADRFGYSTASVHQMATLLRAGRLSLLTGRRPGPAL